MSTHLLYLKCLLQKKKICTNNQHRSLLLSSQASQESRSSVSLRSQLPCRLLQVLVYWKRRKQQLFFQQEKKYVWHTVVCELLSQKFRQPHCFQFCSKYYRCDWKSCLLQAHQHFLLIYHRESCVLCQFRWYLKLFISQN